MKHSLRQVARWSVHSYRRLPRALLGLTIGMLASAHIASAKLNPDEPLRSLLHQSWQTAQGLPQSSALAVAQTQNGYIWVGTEEGLARFDGTAFTVFNLRNSGLPNKTVTSLYPASGNALWIGTNGGGLARLDDDRFTVYTVKNGLPTNSILCLHQDKRGVLWIGTDGGGLVGFTNGHFRVFTKADGLADNTVFNISEDSAGVLWIGTHNGFNTLFGDKLVTPTQNGVLKLKNVNAVLPTKDGSVWIGTSDGLYVLSQRTVRRFTAADGFLATTVSSLMQDSAGSIWIGTNPCGLTRYANGKFDRLAASAVTGSTLWSIVEDIEGNIWFGCGSGGLHSLKAAAIRTIGLEAGLPSETLLGTFQDRDGGLWIGSDRGLTHLHNGRVTNYGVLDGLPDSLVFSIAQDHNGVIWVGTRRGVVSIKDGHVKQWSAEGLTGVGMVDCTFVDRAGNVWFGSRSGLTRFDGSTFTTFTTKDGLSSNFVLSLSQGTDGAIWIGTQGGGLNRLKDGHFTTWTTRNGLANDVIHAILADEAGDVWLGTNGGGLSRLRDGKLATVTTENGLYDDNIFSVLDDKDGHLWLSSNRGIFSVSKQQYTAVVDGRMHLLTPAVYGDADGMKSHECNGGFQPAGWRLQDGQIAFPTMAGLAVLAPHSQTYTGHKLSAVVERLLVDGRKRSVSEFNDVPPGRGQLEFHFTAPNFTHANSIQFSYILEGFDKDWTAAGNRRAAYYTNIPHGRYRFRVRARYGDDTRDSGTSVSLNLQPHFYETLPFFVLVGMTIVGGCAGAYSWRVNRLKNREQELLRLVNERTAALTESERQVRRSRDELEIRVQERTIELVRSNHALEAEISVRRRTEEQLILAKDSAEQASKAKSDFLANISHEIRTPINGIVGMTDIALSTELEEEQREYLEVVKSSADSLLGIVNAVLDFSNIEARQFRLDLGSFGLRESLADVTRRAAANAAEKSLRFSSFIDPAVPETLVGDAPRLKQVVINLLDNAVKFTKAGFVHFEVTVESETPNAALLHFSVADSGIGVSPEKQNNIFEPFNQADNSSTRRYGGTGLGLTIAAQIACLMDGRLWVESDGRQGSVFHFTARLDSVLAGAAEFPAVQRT